MDFPAIAGTVGDGGTGGTAGNVCVAGAPWSALTAAPAGSPSFPTRKVLPHLLQRTLTPLSVTLSSGILNRVWHCSHLTIMVGHTAAAARR
jgi:hypothetical protein